MTKEVEPIHGKKEFHVGKRRTITENMRGNREFVGDGIHGDIKDKAEKEVEGRRKEGSVGNCEGEGFSGPQQRGKKAKKEWAQNTLHIPLSQVHTCDLYPVPHLCKGGSSARHYVGRARTVSFHSRSKVAETVRPRDRLTGDNKGFNKVAGVPGHLHSPGFSIYPKAQGEPSLKKHIRQHLYTMLEPVGEVIERGEVVRISNLGEGGVNTIGVRRRVERWGNEVMEGGWGGRCEERKNSEGSNAVMIVSKQVVETEDEKNHAGDVTLQ